MPLRKSIRKSGLNQLPPGKAPQWLRYIQIPFIAIGLWGLLFPPLCSGLILLLMLCPLIFVARAFDKSKITQEDSGSLIIIALTASLCLLAAAALEIKLYEWHIVAILSLVIGTGLGGGLYALLFRAIKPKSIGTMIIHVSLFTMLGGFPYVWGTLMWGNDLFDTSAPISRETKILDKSIRLRNKGRAHYNLTLAPWGSFVDSQKIDVDHSLYNHVETGEMICPLESEGAFGIPYYRLTTCAENSTQ